MGMTKQGVGLRGKSRPIEAQHFARQTALAADQKLGGCNDRHLASRSLCRGQRANRSDRRFAQVLFLRNEPMYCSIAGEPLAHALPATSLVWLKQRPNPQLPPRQSDQ